MRKQLLMLVSLVALAGCEMKYTPYPDPGPTQVSISIRARNGISGVQKLTVMAHPALLMNDCEKSAPRLRGGCVTGQSNLRFFTDREGVNRPVKPQGAPCPGTNAAPTDPRCWVAENDLTLFDALAADTLPTVYIARDNEIESFIVNEWAAFSEAVFNRWAITGERDSYVWLSDGRECEVRPLFPRPVAYNPFLGPLPDWVSFGTFPLADFSIRPGDRWLLELVVDLGSIDPALCETNQPLYVTPVSVTPVLLDRCPDRRVASCVTE